MDFAEKNTSLTEYLDGFGLRNMLRKGSHLL